MGVVVGDEIEFVGPNTDKNYKKRTKVLTVINSTTLQISALDHFIAVNSYYRIHGTPIDASGNPLVAFKAGQDSPIKLYIDDATLFPLASQNPFTITVGEGETKERFEVLDIDNREAWIRLSDIETIEFDHFVGEPVALEVKHIALHGDTVAWPDKGAFYLDYGFRGNQLLQTGLNLTGIATTKLAENLSDRVLIDTDANFLSAYGDENKNALLGYKVIIGSDESTVIQILNDTVLLLTSGVSVGSDLSYTIASPGIQ